MPEKLKRHRAKREHEGKYQQLVFQWLRAWQETPLPQPNHIKINISNWQLVWHSHSQAKYSFLFPTLVRKGTIPQRATESFASVSLKIVIATWSTPLAVSEKNLQRLDTLSISSEWGLKFVRASWWKESLAVLNFVRSYTPLTAACTFEQR